MTKCNCDPDGCCNPKKPAIIVAGGKCRICNSLVACEHEWVNVESVQAKPTLEERQVVALEKIACRLKTMLKTTDFKRPKVRSTYKWKDYTSKKFKAKKHNDYTEKWTNDKDKWTKGDKDESKNGCGC